MESRLSKRNFPESEIDIFEHPVGKSETIPGQALHISEIMNRAIRGAILPEVENNKLEYGDDETFDDVFENEHDLTDMEEASNQVSYYQSRLNEIKQAKKQALPNNPSETEKQTDGEELPSPTSE